MYISDVRIVDSLSKSQNALALQPQIENPSWRLLTDTQYWFPVSGLYRAHGGEKYIVIGDFKDNGNSHTSPGDTSRGFPAFSENVYYLEDVSVVPVNIYLHRYDTICHGPFWVHARYKGVGCLWPDGTHGDSFLITKSGVYPVVYDSVNYAAIDSINVIYRNLIPTISDTILCSGTSYAIKLPSTNTYLWQDGNKQDSISINKEGQYWVTTTNGTCSYTDTFSVKYDNIVSLNLPSDTIICRQFPWNVNLNNIGYPVLWQDGSTATLYKINKAGHYSVSVINACKSAPFYIEVQDTDCSCAIYTPNAFTPGSNDNVNFRSVSICTPVKFEMRIYNRWGVRVFQSNEITAGWDGSYKGTDSEIGVYYYVIDYVPYNSTDPKTIKGTVQLLR